MKTTTSQSILIIAIYFGLALVGILNHEIWLDESHHWLLARDSGTFSEFLQNTRYEGHPILWNILLYVVTRFTSDPVWMQVLHIVIATSAIWVFLRKSSFSLIFKVLFVFGYFMLYEYSIISRNYMLGVLFLFLACSYYLDSKKWIWIGLWLALAANTHLMFWVIAFGFSLFVLFRIIIKQTSISFSKVGGGLALFLFGMILAVFQMIPPEGASLYGHLNYDVSTESLTTGVVSVFKGWVPIPDFRSIHFWNSNLLVNLSKPVSGVVGILCYAIPWVLFRKNKSVLFFAYITLVGTQFFFFFTQLSATRYFGMTFVILILSLWLYRGSQTEDSSGFKGVSKIIVFGILIIQVIAGGIAYGMDKKHSFSSGKAVKAFLEENNLDGRTVVTPFCQGTIISSDLQKKVFFLCGESMQSYCNWNADCERGIDSETIIEKLTASSLAGPYVFVAKVELTNSKEPLVWQKVNERLYVRWLGKIPPQVQRNVDYSVYEIDLRDE